MIAPEETINDAEQAAIIKGQVLDPNCNPIEGAVVEIWYAGENPGKIYLNTKTKDHLIFF
jgi:protocatechuate 3,4-dioxygenase beta subunit